MITPQQAVLESVLERIARIIAGHYGIKVRVVGSRAFINMKTREVFLPATYDQQRVSAAQLHGLLDHECGHALWTDSGVCLGLEDKAEVEGVGAAKTIQGLWNGCEDVWTEKKTSSVYPGCEQNLKVVNDLLYLTIKERWEDMDALGRLHYALDRCYRGDKEVGDFSSDDQMGAMVAHLSPEVRRGRVCHTSAEALSIAEAIHEKIKQMAEGMPQPHPRPGDDGGGDPDPQNADGSGDSTVGGEDIGGEEAFLDRAARDQAKGFLDQQDSTGFEKPLDVEGLVNEQQTDFDDWSTSRDPDRYIVFTTEYDFDTTYDAQERGRCADVYTQIRNDAKPLVGHLSRVLELALVAETEARWVPGARRGRKFDRRRLNRWVAGSEDDRLWVRKEGGESIDTAVTLLWDCSGSMGSSSGADSKARLARIAAVAFHEALCRCRGFGVDHEILGFNTNGGQSHRVVVLAEEARRVGDNLGIYSRIEELDARMVFVPWGSDDGRAIAKISGDGCNRDGECVMWAAKRLAEQRAARKILIVGSDGHPQGARYHRTEGNYLREVVQQISNSGIEVHALGIMDRSVAGYYPSWDLVEKAADLPKAVMGVLRGRLLGRSPHAA